MERWIALSVLFCVPCVAEGASLQIGDSEISIGMTLQEVAESFGEDYELKKHPVEMVIGCITSPMRRRPSVRWSLRISELPRPGATSERISTEAPRPK